MHLNEKEELIVKRVVDALLELARRGIIEFKHVDTDRGLIILNYGGCEFKIRLYLVYYPTDPEEWAWTLKRWFELYCR
jgi:hypothetical protein